MHDLLGHKREVFDTLQTVLEPKTGERVHILSSRDKTVKGFLSELGLLYAMIPQDRITDIEYDFKAQNIIISEDIKHG